MNILTFRTGALKAGVSGLGLMAALSTKHSTAVDDNHFSEFVS
jgi:hypothetical protein